MSNDSGSAFIMVATNRPMDLDDAVLRRLPRRLLIDLPTESDRSEILKIHLRNEQTDGVHVYELARKTPFYSGSDLKNLVVASALNAVREENEIVKNGEANNLQEEPLPGNILRKHWKKLLPVFSEDMTSLKQIKKFDEEFGDKAGQETWQDIRIS